VIVLSRWTLVSDGIEKRILTINSDITEKKQLETQFLRSQRLESIGTIASGITHDLNNVLAPICMATELLRSENLRPEAFALISMIDESARRGASIVKQVLTFARGSDGKRTSLDLSFLIKETCKVGTATFPRNIKISFDIQQDLSSVKGDPTQLHQVLMNLCVNARDAMPEGGSLTLAAKNIPATNKGQKLEVLIEVTDTGMGIPADIVEKIFDPFFTTKEPGKGTGLGLSTVLGIVKSHGGRIQVESTPGKGTRFQLFFPAESRTAEGQPNARSPVPKGNGEVILIVDDEPKIRNVTSQTLIHHGYEVLTASDGSEGIIRFAEGKNTIHLVITDLMMPGVDGRTLVKTIRALKPQTKILATSGLAEDESVPAISFLKKPFSAEELLRSVFYVLHPAHPQPVP
jgi:two-component system, cell cycle sensor histidine kinase and response regulator CckA